MQINFIRQMNFILYYIHFEINGVSCNLIGSQECDFSTNRTARSAIRAEIAPSFNQSHLSADFSQPIIFSHRIETANEF
jgi:hypothetical protein